MRFSRYIPFPCHGFRSPSLLLGRLKQADSPPYGGEYSFSPADPDDQTDAAHGDGSLAANWLHTFPRSS